MQQSSIERDKIYKSIYYARKKNERFC